MKTFKELYNLINEGGAAGHMAHPFDLDNVKNGKDLIEFFNRIISSISSSAPSLKIDGVNASFRLINTENGKQFALDRGSMKPLDVEGITIDKLLDRFGEGHGMVNAGQKLLTIMNEALPSITPELKKLGMYDNPNRFFNTEFVQGQTNVLQYDTDFLAIHGINEFFQATPRRRASKEIDYDEKALVSLINKLNKFSKQYNFKVYGSVPVRKTKNPNYENVLNKNFNVIIKNEKISKKLREFLQEAENPFSDKITLQDGKQIGALSKFVYLQILNGVPVDTFVKDESDYQKAIDGAVIYHATRLLGDELLTTLTSDMGDVKYHEGIVVRDKRIGSRPVKITGEFIVSGMDSQFRKEDNEIAPYYGSYISNPPVFNQGEGTRLRTTINTFGEMYEYLAEFDTVNNFKTVVIYPGRFHPFHRGHAAVYNKIKEKYPYADVFISTSDKTGLTSPFSFEEKLKMMKSAGIDEKFVKKVKNPYLAQEITSLYNADNTKVIFVVSEKDMEGEGARFNFKPKKDGSASYFQPLQSVGESEYFGKHGYIDTLPTVDFKILGKDVRSASEIRELFKNSNEKQRKNLIQDLYGSMDNEIYKIFTSKII